MPQACRYGLIAPLFGEEERSGGLVFAVVAEDATIGVENFHHLFHGIVDVDGGWRGCRECLDIADYLVSELTLQGILEGILQRNLALRDLVNKLDLEIVSVEKMTDEEITTLQKSNVTTGAAVSR